MADSNITKKALAESLKEIMKTVPFDKITVAQICDGCDMNRKSFYYHFKDKYDLVNWIFDTEFIKVASERSSKETYEERIGLIANICNYFYDNREFYQKALLIKGQNSFSDHFCEYIQPLVKNRILFLMQEFVSIDEAKVDEFTVDFLTDAILCAIERWLLSNECMKADEFLEKIMGLIRTAIIIMQQELNVE